MARFLFIVKSKQIETLGPMYLAAIAKAKGHQVNITDYEFAIPMAITLQPDYICYSVMTGNQNHVKELNRYLRNFFVFKPIVGGPHVTFFKEEFTNDPQFVHDGYIIIGEAEAWFNEFTSYIKDESPPFHVDINELDTIPFPDRTDFPDMPIRDFIATRGCPFKCRYCFNDKWNEMFPDLKKVRYRSVDNVINEIKAVNPSFVYFQDSCFGVSLKWLSEFSYKYRDNISVPYHCHMRPQQINEDRLRMLQRSGCMSVRIALETASGNLRRIIGRPQTSNDETIHAATLLRKYGIPLMIQNMLGLPTSTIEDDLATLEVNIQCRPAYGWSSIFVPFPGTELGEQCVKEGWYKGDYSDIKDNFFEQSVLEFGEERKEQTYVLQKIFALAVEAQLMPEEDELTKEHMPIFVHRAMRKIGDKRLYGGVI